VSCSLRTIFPLGEYRKEEVRGIAEERGLAVAYTPESQDICFIPDGDYPGLRPQESRSAAWRDRGQRRTPLGKHAGVVDFTVGQRRGIGVSAPTPLYVTEVRPAQKQVVVGRRKDLEVREVRIGNLNWFLDREEVDSVQVRYNSAPVSCEIEDVGDGEVRARLAEPVIGIAPGQSAVFYKGDRVVGGGVVRRDA
jgi:tRNA-specific 2-thiouridylase